MLLLDRFCNNRSKPDGLHPNCRICKSKQARKEREKNKDRISKTNKEYSDKNKEKIKAAKHEYYLENKDEIVKRVCLYAKNNRIEHNARGRKTKQKLKVETFSHYCDGDIICKMCNKENDLQILTIDHIDGNGSEHRRELGGSNIGGHQFYGWLKKNGYPEGFQVLCFNCQFRKRAIELKPKNPTHLQLVRAKYARSIKLECLRNYGGEICKCGETDMNTLTLDHVNDDGAEHRRETGTRGNNFYHMLRKNGFPNDPPLQVLCLNCQIFKRNKGYATVSD